MASFEDLYGSPYLKASDVPPEGVRCIIVEVGTEVFHKKGERDKTKILIRVPQFRKQISINTTNGNRLMQAWGDDFEQWAGNVVIVSRHTVQYEGKNTDGILLTPVVKSDGEQS